MVFRVSCGANSFSATTGALLSNLCWVRTPEASAGATGRPGSLGYLVAETVAFLSELTLLAVLGVTGWRLGGGALMSVALAALYPALAALIWSVWLAPRATHQLAQPWRLVLQVGLFVAAGVGCALSGLVVLGVALAGIGSAAFVVTHLLGPDPRDPNPRPAPR